MIRRNDKYGNVEDVTIVEFGYGTLSITNSIANDYSYQSLLIKSQSAPQKIGSIGGIKHENSDDFNPELAIVFHSEESFSVFEEFVKNIRKEYDENKPQ